MRRVMTSKPVLLLGAGALTRRMMNNAQARRRKRKSIGGKLMGLALAGGIGAAIRFFSDSVSGPRRREKVKRLMGKAEGLQPWSGRDGESQDSVQLSDSSPSQTQ